MEETSKNNKTDQLDIVTTNRSSNQMNTIKQELIELYMQGWLDRDWKIGEDEADEKAELYAVRFIKKNICC